MVRFVADLLVRETELSKAGSRVGLIAEPIPRLLGGGAVIVETIGLDDQGEVGPVEVDFEVVHPLPGQWNRQASLPGQREEPPFELLLGQPKGPPVEDVAEPGDAGFPLASIERLTQLWRMDEVVLVRLVDRTLDSPPVEAKRLVDEGLDRSGDRDVVTAGGVALEIERWPSVN